MGKNARRRAARKQVRESVIALYAKVASEILPQRFVAKTSGYCINAARVTIDVLARFGVEGKATATACLVMNAVLRKLVEERGGIPRDFPKEWEAQGAWGIGVDGRTEADGGTNEYSAHVVVLVDDCMIDASVGQFSRPQREINMPAILVATVPDDFLRGEEPIFLGKRGDGPAITYWNLPQERGFENASGFRSHENNLQVTDEIIRAMAARIKQAKESTP